MSSLPYAAIPTPPEEYNAATVLSRLMDGLGFRYHWATDGLTEEVLAYRPETTCRSVREILHHIRAIVDMIEHSVMSERYQLPEPHLPDNADVRGETLSAISRVSATLRASDPTRLAEFEARFRMDENDMDFPFWNTINGTMSDAIYHVGQVVAYRRAAGLPIDQGVDVFVGKQAAPVGGRRVRE